MLKRIGAITLKDAFEWCLEVYRDIAALLLTATIVGAILNGILG